MSVPRIDDGGPRRLTPAQQLGLLLLLGVFIGYVFIRLSV
jgi:hypothetical protein